MSELYAMTDSELANVLYFEPERFDEVIEVLANEDEISRLGNIAELLREELVPEEELGDHQNNEKIRKTLSRIYEYGDAIYPEDDEIIYMDEEYSDLGDTQGLLIPEGMTEEEYARLMEETDEQIEDFYDKHPELDDRVDSPVPKGMSIEEYSEAMGAYIDELEEMSPLSKRKISVSEIKEVAEGQRIESKNGAMNAVTSPEEEKIVEGQSHNDE